VHVNGKVIVVTGAASGIGRALAERFSALGARGIVVADRDAEGAERVARAIGAHAFTADVAREADIVRLVDHAETAVGPIDLFCSNAGISAAADLDTPDADWERTFGVNVMAHVYAARHVVPRMLTRGGGYLLNTASAAGLLSQIGSVTYAVSKHAAVAFAEWVSITYGDAGIRVSVLCPQGVRTAMTANVDTATAAATVDGMLEPEAVADAVVEALAEERFLVLPHPQVLGYMQRKTADYDRWLRGMRRLQARLQPPPATG
jgi:NAD(P)-dependent dehydrogenase (short-subunit alcohol dehydrogenase family)